MNRRLRVLAVLLAMATAPLSGGTAAEFTIDRYTIDGGGGTSSGGPFSLSGTIGQHDAGPVAAQGGLFRVVGGFWGGAADLSDRIFRDGFENP